LETAKLNELATLINGRAYLMPELQKQGKYRIVRVGNFTGKDEWYYSDMELAPEKYCEDGDLLFKWACTFGPEYWHGEKSIYHYHIWKVVVNDLLMDKDYLYYYLKLMTPKWLCATNGSTMVHLTKETMENEIVSFPSSLGIQKAVAATLRLLDDAIENNNSICADLEAAAKLLYDYWFVQFEFPDENGKPYKSSGGKMVWSDELKREIPAGWNVRQISDLVKIKKGISYKSSEITGGGTPMINLASFNLDGTYKPSGIKFFSGTVDANRTVDACDLIMCVTQQTDIDLTGRANVIGKAILTPDLFDSQVVISTDVVKLETETADICFWLEGLFKQAYIHKYIVGYANGTKIKHLDVYEALNFFAACPPDDTRVLQRYSSIRATQMELYSTLQGEIESLTKTRDFLLPLLMNGQVTIGDDGK
jgi:type I restriction enzyme S subunit